MATIDTLLNGNFSRYGYSSTFQTQCREVFTALHKKGETLTENQVDELVTKTTKGKSRSLLGNSSNFVVLDLLTEHHMLNQKQVDMILCCFKSINSTNSVWIDNLVTRGYKLTPKQQKTLNSYGYLAGPQLIISQSTATITDLLTICTHPKTVTDLSNVIKFCEKFNIVPNDQCLSVVLSRSQNTWSDILKTFIKLKFVPTNQTLKNMLPLGYSRNLNSLDMVLEHLQTLDNPNILIDALLKCSNAFFDSVAATLGFISKKFKVIPQLEHLHSISKLSRECDKGTYSSHHVLSHEKLINFLLDTYKIEPTLETINRACMLADEILFNIAIKGNILPESITLVHACKGGSIPIISALLNMKLIPDKECLRVLNGNYHQPIIKLLVSNGIYIDYDTLDMCFQNAIYFTDLQSMGIDCDDRLYEICHKYNYFPQQYLSSLTIPKDVITFRTMFSNQYQTVALLKEYMTKTGVIPDQYCYNNALAIRTGPEIQSIRNWLETEYKLKPTILSIMRIADPLHRLSLYNQYVKSIDASNIQLTLDEKHSNNVQLQNVNYAPNQHYSEKKMIANESDYEVEETGQEPEPEEEEPEEEEPVKKATKKPIYESDEEEVEEDESEDEPEEKSVKKATKKLVYESDDEEDDELPEEKPVKKVMKKAVKK
jgi:hypothetical protein